jgi:hypothetical protein
VAAFAEAGAHAEPLINATSGAGWLDALRAAGAGSIPICGDDDDAERDVTEVLRDSDGGTSSISATSPRPGRWRRTC